MHAENIRVRGLVQGVGFRPTVWRLAHDLSLHGDVRNDGEGVLIRIRAQKARVDVFCNRLLTQCPPLARIDAIERSILADGLSSDGFHIIASAATAVHTGVAADAATCAACTTEIRDASERRFRYPFTNCTHCGPRLSIVRSIPYDRGNTSMSVFRMCEACRREYEDPADRRFHAQPIACPVCGPRVWLEDAEGNRPGRKPSDNEDPIAAASRLLREGRILAIKGIGGFHLACDACNEAAVSELRARKRRFRKPFALMARDLDVIRLYCTVSDTEAELLQGTAAPVVLLDTQGPRQVAADIAPGQTTLGFMLPYSPLHQLLLQAWEQPLVMTSGNLSEEPQCIDNGDATKRLDGLADVYLLHDREIVNRVDDSVARLMDGIPRLLRRARGYAPSPIRLPPGFEQTPQVLAFGGELKNTICLLNPGQAILSQHLGDLEEARTAGEYERTIRLYRALFRHTPEVLAVDSHPDYRSSQSGRAMATDHGLELVEVQHHFAHIASVLADSGWPLDGGPVIGIALDGLGYGDDGTIWGGELLLTDYRGFKRLGHLKPTPLLGGAKAMAEPWRNTYAQIATHLGWQAMEIDYPDLDLTRFLAKKPRAVLDTMLKRGLNSPPTSSCGRLFDAVAAALNLSRDAISFEGQAAIELEALSIRADPEHGVGYPFAVTENQGRQILDPAPLWSALLDDLAEGQEPALIAARFQSGLAQAVADLAAGLAGQHSVKTVALSGGVFQNKTLLEGMTQRIHSHGLSVLSHQQVPTNDGGLALGQAVIAAVRQQ